MGFHFARFGCPDSEFGSSTTSCQGLCYPSQESFHGRFVLLYIRIRPCTYRISAESAYDDEDAEERKNGSVAEPAGRVGGNPGPHGQAVPATV